MLDDLLRSLWTKSTVARHAITLLLLAHRVGWWKFATPRARIFSRLGIGPEPKVWNTLRRVKGKLFVDVGAGYGWYVTLLRENFLRIVAIEADQDVASYLKLHVPANCEVFGIAVSDRDGSVRLGRSPTDPCFLLPGIRSSQIGDESVVCGETVCSRSLSSLFESDLIDLIMVDVEGAEWLVLKGAEKIMMNIKAWLIELHDPTRKIELASYMKRHHYNCRWVDDAHAYFQR